MLYRERDYRFGQRMLTWRSKIGLTQAGLADFLGLSRRAVGDWEAGSSYPKADHLKKFIRLGLERGIFLAGSEEDEIRLLWQDSHQKELLEDAWLTALMRDSAASYNGATGEMRANLTVMEQGRRFNWGDAVANPNFYGRQGEIERLADWVLDEHCRVVGVLGLGGAGKSALASNLMHRVAEKFNVVIWRSVGNMPSSEVLLKELLDVFAPETPPADNAAGDELAQKSIEQPAVSLDQRQSALLENMRKWRVLLVLDGLEAALWEGEKFGRFRPGYEGLERFLRLCAETDHQSCVLLTSREEAAVLVPQEGSRAPVRMMRLDGLDGDSCEHVLAEKDIDGSPVKRAQLIRGYSGNPLALKIAAKTIGDVFAGKIDAFLEQGEVIFGGVGELLGEQFGRLSAFEKCLLFWLAVLGKPATLDDLAGLLTRPAPRAQLLEAVEALRGRSLIQQGQKAGSFILQGLVMEYATAKLISELEKVQKELPDAQMKDSLDAAQASEFILLIGERLLASPLAGRLRRVSADEGAVEEKLLVLLDRLARADGQPGSEGI